MPLIVSTTSMAPYEPTHDPSITLRDEDAASGSAVPVDRRGQIRTWIGATRNRSPVYVRDLLWVLVARDLKLRYKRSVLGVAWTLVLPLAQFLVIHFIFTEVLPLNMPNYAALVFSGLISWAWFHASLQFGALSVVGNRDMIRQTGFPLAVLPLVTVASNFIHFLLALPVLAVILFYEQLHSGWALLAFPVVVAIQFALTLGLAYLVAVLQVYFRDTQHLLTVVLSLLMFLTPIFYDAKRVPANFQPIYRLNPMVHIIGAYRSILMDGTPPGLGSMLGVGTVSALLLACAFGIYVRASRRFVEEV